MSNKKGSEKMIQGTVASGLEKVKVEFEKNFTDRNEIGAACAIYLEGKKVVDLWGGYRDKRIKKKSSH